MNKWTLAFLDMADRMASLSKDRTQVGALIVDPQRRFVSGGFNGFPRGVEDTAERLQDRDVKLRMMIHAEENAIHFANCDLTGCTIYATQPPCAQCAARIIQNGLAYVVTRPATSNMLDRWAGDYELAQQMYAEANVEYVEVG